MENRYPIRRLKAEELYALEREARRLRAEELARLVRAAAAALKARFLAAGTKEVRHA